VGVVCLFSRGSRELLIKIFIITSRFHISCMEPLFVVAKIISPGKVIAYFSFKVVSSVIMTVTVLLCLETHE